MLPVYTYVWNCENQNDLHIMQIIFLKILPNLQAGWLPNKARTSYGSQPAQGNNRRPYQFHPECSGNELCQAAQVGS